jgi:hypothetical protein
LIESKFGDEEEEKKGTGKLKKCKLKYRSVRREYPSDEG